MAADDKYPVLNTDKLTIRIQMQLSEKRQTFSLFFAPFLKSILNFKYFKQKYDPHRFCLSEITDSENVVTKMPGKSCLRGLFEKQHGKSPQALLKSASQHLYHIHWLLASQLSWKESLFLTCKTLGLLVNALPPDEKYPVLKRDNLTIPILMLLSQKQQTFSDFFFYFF